MGVTITAKGEAFDFVSRSFFPKLSVNEDPVCGSAHCYLVPYWAKQLEKNTLTARQLSKRGGTLYCQYSEPYVRMSGSAVLYAISEVQLGK